MRSLAVRARRELSVRVPVLRRWVNRWRVRRLRPGSEPIPVDWLISPHRYDILARMAVFDLAAEHRDILDTDEFFELASAECLRPVVPHDRGARARLGWCLRAGAGHPVPAGGVPRGAPVRELRRQRVQQPAPDHGGPDPGRHQGRRPLARRGPLGAGGRQPPAGSARPVRPVAHRDRPVRHRPQRRPAPQHRADARRARSHGGRGGRASSPAASATRTARSRRGPSCSTRSCSRPTGPTWSDGPRPSSTRARSRSQSAHDGGCSRRPSSRATSSATAARSVAAASAGTALAD